MHYVELAPEAPYEIAETQDQAWPASGQITFKYVLTTFTVPEWEIDQMLCRDYSTRYRPELDLVLKKIDITIVRTSLSLADTWLIWFKLEC